MVKKRGGRRGKASQNNPVEDGATSEMSTQPPAIPVEHPPSTSFEPVPSTSSKVKPLPISTQQPSNPAMGRGRAMGRERGKSEIFPRPGLEQSTGETIGEKGKDEVMPTATPLLSTSAEFKPLPISTQQPPMGRGRGKSENLYRPGHKMSDQGEPKSALDIKKKGFQLQPIKSGTLGRKIRILTNHVALDVSSLKGYLYDVSIEPQKKPKALLKKAMELFKQAHYPHNHPHYDGQKLLFSGKKLPLTNDMAQSEIVVDEGRSQTFNVTIKLVKDIDLSLVHNLPQKKYFIIPEEVIRCLEGALKEAINRSFLSIGRRFYTPTLNNQFPLGTGAEMHLGGYQAVNQGSRLYLNVDVAHKAFTVAITLANLLQETFSTKYNRVDLQIFQFQRWQEEEFVRYLKGLKIIYEIPNQPGSKKCYKINNLAGRANEETFEHEGATISVGDYFKQKRHTMLRYPNLPTISCGGGEKKICIPMEFCTLKEGQPLEGSRLRGTQTANMIKYAATSTSERKRKIMKLMEQANYNQNPCIEEFGITIGDDFEALDARVLTAPTLEYFDGKDIPKEGAWWGNKKFKKGAIIQDWRMVGFGVKPHVKGKMNSLADDIKEYGTSSGMVINNVGQPIAFVKNERELIEYLEKFKQSDFVTVIIQDKNAYFTVKRVAEKQIGCLTQCIKAETLLYKLNATTIKNILLKLNGKNNGINHSVRFISDKPCMIMGADVTHPGSQGGVTPSVAAVTASLDPTATFYNVSTFLQVPQDTMSEIIQDLEEITLNKLKLFAKGVSPPEKICFYRDGVAEGDFQRVRDLEIKAIKNACERYKKGYSPKLTFIVVQKRHHTRFFPSNRDSTGFRDKFENVPVGTCVDTVIINPNFPNFILQSHQSIRGVARPTKYSVLLDENNMSMDDLQRLTFSLCHLFVRCNRSVRYPAPTYFADLAAERAKGYLFGTREIDATNQKLIQIKESFAQKYPMFFI